MKNILLIFSLLVGSINLSAQHVDRFKKISRTQPGSFLIPHEEIRNKQTDQQFIPEKLSVSTLKKRDFLLKDTVIVYAQNPITGNPSFIKKTNSISTIKFKSDGFLNISPDEINNTAFSALKEISTILKIDNPENNFIAESNEKDINGNIHVKMKQHIQGIPVYGGELFVHISKKENEFCVNGKYLNFTNIIDTNNLLNEKYIIGKIEDDLRFNKGEKIIKHNLSVVNLSPEISKVIVSEKNTTNGTLAYHVRYWPNIVSKWEYFIDAKDGRIIKSFETSCSVDISKISTAKDLSGNSKTFGTLLSANVYYLVDVSRPMYNASKGTGYIVTYDNKNDTAADAKLVSSKNDTWDPKAVSAHTNAISCYEYFRTVHGRNSMDNKGMNVVSLINVPDPRTNKPMDNAYWNGKAMFYGNGEKYFNKPFQTSEDVGAHEMSHAVTQFSSGLEYFSQSGAINESMSDIFAVLIDTSNWLIGEKIVNPAYYKSGALRDMSNPHNGGIKLGDPSWQPEHMSEYYNGELDNQGVHVNSGIPNRAFYLIASNPSIGRTKAGKLYYHALTKYLFRQAEFSDLRLAVIQSTKDLFGNSEVEIVSKAFDAVGIIENLPIIQYDTLKINPGTEYLLTYDTDRSDPNGLFRRNSKGAYNKVILNKTVASKPSVSDNGKFAVFVGTDKKLYSLSLDPAGNNEKTVIQDQAIWENVAISKDGKRLAAVTNSIDTSIYVYDFDKKAWYRYMLYAPTFTYGIDAKGPLFADGLEWDYTGQNLIYDCLNSIKDSSGKDITYWDIGLINVWNSKTNSKTEGRISKLFSLNDGVSIGNPTFSKNYPGKIAFDYYSEIDKVYAVIGYDMKFNTVKVISMNNKMGYPNFDRLDQRIAFGTDSSGIDVIKYVMLNSDKISSSDQPKKLVNYAKWPIFFTYGNRNIVVPPKPIITSNGNNGLCNGQSITLTSSSDVGNQWYKNGLKISSGIAKTFQATESGNYMVIVTIDSVSSLPSTPVTIVFNPQPSKPVITRDIQGFLVSSSTNNNQWYKESTFTGDTTQKYKPSTSGYFTVKVVKFGCASEGAIYYYLLSATQESTRSSKIVFYPNPTHDELYVSSSNTLKVVYISVFDINGRAVLLNKKVESGSKVNLGSVSKGNYIIQVMDGAGRLISSQKLVKE
jgi:Zn-dependent metalloprotease